MSHRELEALVGEKIPPKRELQLVGDRLFHRVEGAWEEYPPYPEPPDAA